MPLGMELSWPFVYNLQWFIPGWLHILLEHARRPRVQGVVKALFECGMLPTVLSGSSVGSISASSSHSALPPHVAIVAVVHMIQLRTCFPILPLILDPGCSHLCSLRDHRHARRQRAEGDLPRHAVRRPLLLLQLVNSAGACDAYAQKHTLVQSIRCDRTFGYVRRR